MENVAETVCDGRACGGVKMERITITNALGESVVMATNSGVNRLTNFTSTPLKDTAISVKGYQQDGALYEAAYTEVRDFTVRGYMFGQGKADLYEKRREFKRVLNPKLGLAELKYQNDYFSDGLVIPVKIDTEPVFASDKDGLRYHTQTFGVSLTAYDPYWRDREDTEVELIGMEDPFLWDDPEYFAEATPFYLGQIASASVRVFNGGDVPAPLTIEWVGAATNPKILLEDTGEYILLDKILEADEKLIITTAYGQKAVYVEDISTGERVKDFSIVNPASSFFKLPVGYSTISLSADAGAASAAVKLIYKNLYYGV